MGRDVPTNLPTQPTSFVGRADELADVARLLGRDRLVTLTGSGGCGKTRLAMAAAAAAGSAGGWPDGVWWVDLGPVADPGRVAQVAADALRVMVEPAGGPLRAVAQALRDRRLLVCLDNCEHLLDAAAELADTLLRSCPEVSLLATSRELLGVPGETVWRVPSLVEDEAVALFAVRAAQAHPGFALDAGAGDGSAVRTICRRLDGIPLAIELAAAWMGDLAPAQVAAGLGDRFRLLDAGGSTGVRRLVSRHQTLAASVGWSHDLLDDGERRVFRQLAVFAGGFTLDAVRVVCSAPAGPAAPGGDDVLVTLGRLVDKSLVVADEAGGDARYRLLETIRQYAEDRLAAAGEAVAARDRHLDHFLALAEAAEPELEQADQDAWLARLEAEHDNLRAALDWGLAAPDPDRGRRLAAALTRLWMLRGHGREGSRYLSRAIGRAPGDRSALQARLFVGAALAGATGGEFASMAESVRRGLELAEANGDDRSRARCLCLQANIDSFFDFAACRARAAEARRYAETAGDAFGVDLSLLLEGLALADGDDHDAARPVLAAAIDRCRRRGDRQLAAFALTGETQTAQRTGDLEAAGRLAAEAVRLAEPLGDYFTVGTAISNLAWVMGMTGDVGGALRLMAQVVRSVEDGPRAAYVPTMAVSLGQLHLWNGDLDRARAWFEQASRFAEPLVDNMIVARALPGLGAVHARRGDRDTAQAHLDRAVALGRSLGQPRIVADALDARAALAADDPEQTEGQLHEALAIRVERGLRTFWPASLDALAGHAARTGRPVDAARLWAASGVARDAMGYPRPPVDRADHDAAVADVRGALGDAAFRVAWAEGRALGLDDAIGYVTRARGARGRPPTGWASLTATERRVVRLVGEGLTNPEIGARLLMSRNTVKTHLSHVYGKLGVANRTELAALAAERPTRGP